MRGGPDAVAAGPPFRRSAVGCITIVRRKGRGMSHHDIGFKDSGSERLAHTSMQSRSDGSGAVDAVYNPPWFRRYGRPPVVVEDAGSMTEAQVDDAVGRAHAERERHIEAEALASMSSTARDAEAERLRRLRSIGADPAHPLHGEVLAWDEAMAGRLARLEEMAGAAPASAP